MTQLFYATPPRAQPDLLPRRRRQQLWGGTSFSLTDFHQVLSSRLRRARMAGSSPTPAGTGRSRARAWPDDLTLLGDGVFDPAQLALADRKGSAASSGTPFSSTGRFYFVPEALERRAHRTPAQPRAEAAWRRRERHSPETGTCIWLTYKCVQRGVGVWGLEGQP